MSHKPRSLWHLRYRKSSLLQDGLATASSRIINDEKLMKAMDYVDDDDDNNINNNNNNDNTATLEESSTKYDEKKKRNSGGNNNNNNNSSSSSSSSIAMIPSYSLAKHSAASIFSAAGRTSPCQPLKIVTATTGQEIQFQLTRALNQKPKQRSSQEFHVKNINVQASPYFVRMRVYVMQFGVMTIIVGYLVAFVLLNLLFAILWYIAPNNGGDSQKCCGDPTMTFAQVLHFAIQTSTTLGYGDNEPVGLYSNILVALNFFASLTLHALFAGIIFLKFVTPSAKLEFSTVMTLSNVNGVPCLEIRVGNADGDNMRLLDLTAKLHFMFTISYQDECGAPLKMTSMEELKLLVDWKYKLNGVWTLRHVIDETSPMFGVLGVKELEKDINMFLVTITGMQDVTKMHVMSSASYRLPDIVVGYKFQDQIHWDPEKQMATIDYSKMNEIEPRPVWYPVEHQPHGVEEQRNGARKYSGGLCSMKEEDVELDV